MIWKPPTNPRGCPPQHEESGRAPQSTQPVGRTVQRSGPGLCPAIGLRGSPKSSAPPRGGFCVVKRLAPLPSFLPTPIPASSYRKSTDAAVDPKPRSRLWLGLAILPPRNTSRSASLDLYRLSSSASSAFFLTQGLVGRFLLQAFHRQFIRAFHVSPSFSSRVDREIWWAA